MAEALARVKRELGRGAVILNTRTVKEPGWLGLRARARVEIPATDEPDVLRAAARRATIPTRSGRSAHAEDSAEGAAMAGTTAVQSSDLAPKDLHNELRRVRALVEDVLVETRRPRGASALPRNLRGTYLHLIQQEVSEKVAADLLNQLRNELTGQQLADAELVRNRLGARMAQMIPEAGPVGLKSAGRPSVVALIGPTGVGKTTTVAKLAANFKLRENRNVALITIDTYRIAAVDQLKTYAQIIDVPLSVVLTPEELKAAIARHRDAYLELIHTAGRSQNDAIRLNELKRFLDAAQPQEIHLVLSLTSTRSHLLRAAEAFAPLGVNRVILTKLDEAVGFGVILGVMEQVQQKLSYLTTGQNVPDDIVVYEGGRYASRMLVAAGQEAVQ